MSRYEFQDGLYRPVVDKVFLYVDDGGLRAMDFEGYSGLLLDAFSRDKLRTDLEGLYEQERVTELHSRAIKGRNIQKYERVYKKAFDILTNVLLRTEYRHFVFQIGSEVVTSEIKDSVNSRFRAAFDQIGDTDILVRHPDILSHLIFPVNDILFRVSRCEGIRLVLVIDRKYDFETIGRESFLLGGRPYDGEKALLMTVNAFLNNNLHNGCNLHNINIVRSSSCPILQVVDGLGNFAFNYIKTVVKGLSKASAKERMKHGVFRHFLLAANLDIDGLDSQIKEKFELCGQKMCYLSDEQFLRIEILPPLQSLSP
jgi:hypothetical protein